MRVSSDDPTDASDRARSERGWRRCTGLTHETHLAGNGSQVDAGADQQGPSEEASAYAPSEAPSDAGTVDAAHAAIASIISVNLAQRAAALAAIAGRLHVVRALVRAVASGAQAGLVDQHRLHHRRGERVQVAVQTTRPLCDTSTKPRCSWITYSPGPGPCFARYIAQSTSLFGRSPVPIRPPGMWL
jgi:hypothetical protein